MLRRMIKQKQVPLICAVMSRPSVTTISDAITLFRTSITFTKLQGTPCEAYDFDCGKDCEAKISTLSAEWHLH